MKHITQLDSRVLVLLVTACTSITACTSSSPPAADLADAGGARSPMSKEEASQADGKLDGLDLCELFGWYGDAECDFFCPDPDPDCGGTCETDSDCPEPGFFSNDSSSILNRCARGRCSLGPPVEPPTEPDMQRICVGIPCASVETIRVCSARLGTPCAEGEFCDYPTAGNCGEELEVGQCQATPTPESCSLTPEPACGCDGITYLNACWAQSNGVTVRRPGSCPPPGGCSIDADCRRGEQYELCCPQCNGLSVCTEPDLELADEPSCPFIDCEAEGQGP